MTDEQRPWRAWPEYVTLGLAMQKAHEHDSPSFLRADVDVALDALLARAWREALIAAEAIRDAMLDNADDREQAERTRADAAEAQRDRLAAFVSDFLPVKADHAPADGNWVQCSEHESGHEDGDCPQDVEDDAEVTVSFVMGDLRAALADVEVKSD